MSSDKNCDDLSSLNELLPDSLSSDDEKQEGDTDGMVNGEEEEEEDGENDKERKGNKEGEEGEEGEEGDDGDSSHMVYDSMLSALEGDLTPEDDAILWAALLKKDGFCACGGFPYVRIRDFLNEEFSHQGAPDWVYDQHGVQRDKAITISAYPLESDATRTGLAIVDTHQLYNGKLDRGLGVIAVKAINRGEFIGLFSGNWVLGTTLDTVITEEYKFAGKSVTRDDVISASDNHTPETNLRIDCAIRYAFRFEYDVREPRARTVKYHGGGQKQRNQTANQTSLYCIPQLIAYKTPNDHQTVPSPTAGSSSAGSSSDGASNDVYSCQLAVDIETHAYDAMALINQADDELDVNVECLSTVLPIEDKDRPALVVIAARDIAIGEELLLTYSPPSQRGQKNDYETSFARAEATRVKGYYDKPERTTIRNKALRAFNTYYTSSNRTLPSTDGMPRWFGPAIDSRDHFTLLENRGPFLHVPHRASGEQPKAAEHYTDGMGFKTANRADVANFVNTWVPELPELPDEPPQLPDVE